MPTHLVPSFCFLKQHHLGGAWYTNALLQQLGIKWLWNLASNVSGNIADEGLPADACAGCTHPRLQVHLKDHIQHQWCLTLNDDINFAVFKFIMCG